MHLMFFVIKSRVLSMNCYEYEIHEHVYLIAGKLKRDNVFLVGGSELVLNPLEKIYCITFGKGVLLFFFF